jgi:hypothetical protein
LLCWWIIGLFSFHPVNDIAHGQNFDIPAITHPDELLQHVFEDRNPEGRFGQVLWVQTEVKDPSIAGRSCQPAAEAVDSRPQSDEPGSRRADRIKKR